MRGLGNKPKKELVKRWLNQVVRDCGDENEELAQRVLYALTEEPEKRPAKTKSELQRDVRLLTPALSAEEREFSVQGDLDFVLTVPIGSGLAFEIPAIQEACFQLIHDYLVPPIREQFGMKLTKQLEEERQKRKEAEENVRKRNRWLLQGGFIAVIGLASLAIAAFVFALQANDERAKALAEKDKADQQFKIANTNEQKALKAEKAAINAAAKAEYAQSKEAIAKKEAESKAKEALERQKEAEIAKQNEQEQRNIAEQKAEIAKKAEEQANKLAETNRLDALNTQAVADSLYWKGLIDAELFNLEELIVAIEKAKTWEKDLALLQEDTRLELLATLYNAAHIPKEKIRFEGHQDAILDVALSPDGKSLLTGSYDNTAKLWSIDGRLLVTFKGHTYGVNTVAFAPDGNSFLTGSYDRTVKLWSIDGKVLTTFLGAYDEVTSATFSPDGKLVAMVSRDKTAILWSIDGRQLARFKGHTDEVTSVAFSPDMTSFLTGSRDKTAKLWSIDGRLLVTFQGHTDGVNTVAYSPDGKTILTGSRDGTAKLWNIAGGAFQTIKFRQVGVSSVKFISDRFSSRRILVGSKDGTAKLWSVDGELIKSFEGHQSSITSFASNGEIVVTGSTDKTARLWSLSRLEQSSNPWHQKNEIFSLDKKTDLIGDNINELQTLDKRLVENWRKFDGLEQNDEISYFVGFSADKHSVLTGRGRDKIVRLWDLDGNLLQKFPHQSPVNTVAFSSNDQIILTGSNDGSVRLWNRQGRVIQTFLAHTRSVSAVKLLPDNKTMLTQSTDGKAKLYNFELNHTLGVGCDWLNDFIQDNSPDLPEESIKLRNRAKTACEGIPPPKTSFNFLKDGNLTLLSSIFIGKRD